MNRFIVHFAIAIAIVTQLSVMPAVADDFSWLNALNGNFSDAARWTPEGGPPDAGDAALFSVAGTYTVSGGGTVTIFQVGGGDVTFTGSISTDSQSPGNALFFAGGIARVSGSITSPLSMEIGQDKNGGAGNGTLRVISGGQVQSNAVVSLNDVAVSMAGQATSTATLIIENTNSRLTANGGLNIAGAGTADVQVLAGGELVASGHLPSSTPGIKMGVEAGGTGTLLVDGTAARVNNTLQMNIGQLGHGTFTVTNGGQINTSGNATLPAMVMAFGEGSTGIGYVESAGSLTTNGQFVIGGAGTAEFYLQPGGTLTSNAIGTAAAVFVANAATADAIARVNGGTWDVNGDFFLGAAGHGQVLVETGATLDIANADSLLTIGVQDGGLGELFLNGGQLLRPNTNTAITVGLGGRGRIEIHNGSDVADSRLRVAQVATTAVDPSEVIVEGAGSTLTLKDELDVGMEDAGQLRVVNGGTVSVTGAGSFVQAGGGIGGVGEIFVAGAGSTLSAAGTMTIGGASVGNLSIDNDGQVTAAAATVGRLADSNGSASIATGGSWNVNNDLVVGDHGTGVVYLYQDGTISLPSGKRLILGLNTDGAGILNQFGNGLLDIDTEVVVGQNGTGVFNLYDSATYDTLGNFLLGNLSTARGEVHVNSGSTFTVNGDLTVGVAGDGLLTVDPTSTLDASSGTLAIGQIDGATGEVDVNGGQLLRPADGLTIVGFAGHGRLVIRDGASVNDDEIRVAQVLGTTSETSEVVVEGEGTLLALSGALDLGIEDVGNLAVQSGGQMTAAAAVAGSAPTGQGNVAVEGADSKLTVLGLFILAENGTSLSSIDANGVIESGPSTMARQADSEATMDVANGGMWDVKGNLVVAELGRGFLNVRTDGTVAVQTGSELILGSGPGSSGILNVYGNGSLDIDSDVIIGFEGAGAMNLFDGATYNSFGSIALGATNGASGNISVNSGSTFTVNGDLTMAEAFNGTAGVDVNGAGSTLHAANIHVGGSPTDIGGLAVVNVANQGRILVANTLKLWGGSVNLNGGAVIVGNNSPPADVGSLRVNPLGTLSGSGVVDGNVLNAGGTVAPGNSPGTLTIDGNYTQSSSGLLLVEVESEVSADKLEVSGTATLSGALHVLSNYFPSLGISIEILHAAGGVGGAFTGESFPPLGGNLAWDVFYAPNSVFLAPAPAVTGDYNLDGTVNAADYSVWRNSLGQSGFGLVADGNRDGTITRLDYDVWKLHYGESGGSGAGAEAAGGVIPEPTSLVLVLVAWVFGTTVRARVVR